MSAADKYVHGSWNVICQRCGFQYKGYQLQKEWTGFWVCKGPGTQDCWEPRHEQDFIRAPKPDANVPFVRPEPDPRYVEVPYISTTVGVQE
jgi:hypothetical protein